MAESAEEIRKHLKLYLLIGATLFVFTIITVVVSKFHLGSHGMNIFVGLVIALFKMSLVGLIFMHLKGERPIIYKFLLFTLIFVIGLFSLTYLAWKDPITWMSFREGLNPH